MPNYSINDKKNLPFKNKILGFSLYLLTIRILNYDY